MPRTACRRNSPVASVPGGSYDKTQVFRHGYRAFRIFHPLANTMRISWIVAACCLALTCRVEAQAEEHPQSFRSGMLGVTRQGTPIEFVKETPAAANKETERFHVMIVAGLDGSPACAAHGQKLLQTWTTLPDQTRGQFELTLVPCANPDAVGAQSGPKNASGGNPTRGYPPQGEAYHSQTDPEAAYLWRWIGTQGPDLVIVVSDSEKAGWFAPGFAKDTFAGQVASALNAASWDGPEDALVPQLVKSKPANLGTIPALEFRSPKLQSDCLADLVIALNSSKQREFSAAHQELIRRAGRTPVEVATELSKHYGHDLQTVVYIPAVALMGRVRLGELTGDKSPLQDVMRIVAPYVAGQKESLPERASASHLSGHLIFAELARLMPMESKQRETYLSLARRPADLAFNADGSPRPSLPYHSEMSDAVFMGCPILASVGELSGEARYFEACLRQLRFMQKLCLRSDGLYRHSPLDEAAWGRGNGFPALGLALSLDAWPTDQPGRDEVLKAFQAHMAAVARHQDADGMWHQVIDHPESYRELTATCMITYAMLRGIQNGWLNEDEYRPAIENAWQALKGRIGSDGQLIDVCTGTGKQQNLRAYYDRGAILGRDARGGAMSLLVATEMASWQAKTKRGE